MQHLAVGLGKLREHVGVGLLQRACGVAHPTGHDDTPSSRPKAAPRVARLTQRGAHVVACAEPGQGAGAGRDTAGTTTTAAVPGAPRGGCGRGVPRRRPRGTSLRRRPREPPRPRHQRPAWPAACSSRCRPRTGRCAPARHANLVLDPPSGHGGQGPIRRCVALAGAVHRAQHRASDLLLLGPSPVRTIRRRPHIVLGVALLRVALDLLLDELSPPRPLPPRPRPPQPPVSPSASSPASASPRPPCPLRPPRLPAPSASRPPPPPPPSSPSATSSPSAPPSSSCPPPRPPRPPPPRPRRHPLQPPPPRPRPPRPPLALRLALVRRLASPSLVPALSAPLAPLCPLCPSAPLPLCPLCPFSALLALLALLLSPLRLRLRRLRFRLVAVHLLLPPPPSPSVSSASPLALSSPPPSSSVSSPSSSPPSPPPPGAPPRPASPLAPPAPTVAGATADGGGAARRPLRIPTL